MTCKLMGTIVAPTLAIFCTSSTFAAPDKPVSTALKWDTCSVVQVTDVNDNLFEEGLGSIYDFNENGWAGADEDSTFARVDLSTKEIEVQLGQMHWNIKNTDFETTAQMIDTETYQVKERVIDVKVKLGNDLLNFRLFADKKIGRVTFREFGSKHDLLLAVFDCSGPKDIRHR